MKKVPDKPVSKVIRNPSKAYTWIRNRIIEERIVTPLRARYLFDFDWDVAVILDACRYDLAASQGTEHPINLGEPGKAYSAASNSADWIRRTFGRASADELQNTAYITGNLYTNRLPDTPLAHLDRVWKYAWDDDKGCVPPRPITDRAIAAARDEVGEKYIVHYMQPHLPPISDNPPYEPKRTDPSQGSGANEQSAWDRVKHGEIEEEAVREGYNNNLSPVLDEVSLLLENIEAFKIVITADHGNYLGKNGCWGHPSFEMASPVRHVPWWETSASDEQTHSPAEYDRATGTPSRDDQLKALGYK